MDNFAPVLIPTLNRCEHFRRCVESLSRCTHAGDTDLFIALDYPLNDSHRSGYREIDKYLKTIQSFKSIHVIRRDYNYGARENIRDAKRIIFENYDRIIFSEDDNEFSPNFLDYMNKGLDKFEDDDRVLAICGYMYPVTINCSKEYNYFYGKGFSAWGYGIWKHRNFKTIYTVNDLKKFLKDREFVKKCKYFDEKRFFNIILYISQNENPTGDRAVGIYLIDKEKYCIFPLISKVKNWGHDGSGIHCGERTDDIFIRQEIDKNHTFEFSLKDPLFETYLNETIIRYRKLSFLQKFKYIGRIVVASKSLSYIFKLF